MRFLLPLLLASLASAADLVSFPAEYHFELNEVWWYVRDKTTGQTSWKMGDGNNQEFPNRYGRIDRVNIVIGKKVFPIRSFAMDGDDAVFETDGGSLRVGKKSADRSRQLTWTPKQGDSFTFKIHKR